MPDTNPFDQMVSQESMTWYIRVRHKLEDIHSRLGVILILLGMIFGVLVLIAYTLLQEL